jgi:hypothetical protein
MKGPKAMPGRKGCDKRRAPAAVWLGVLVIILTLALYVIFW